ncbi:hypothetical protein UVI_02032760 [Ustilaginoidea virens]|nr:hypothetical protein UVI_02032760 [Ustilaginoidea virens]
MVAGLGFVLLFLFVPETFWDRTPTRKPSSRPGFLRRLSSRKSVHVPRFSFQSVDTHKTSERPHSPGAASRQKDNHVGFLPASPAAGEFPHRTKGEATALEPSQAEANVSPQPASPRHVGFVDVAELSKSGKDASNNAAPEASGPTNGPSAALSSSPSSSSLSPPPPPPPPPPLDTNVGLVHVPGEHAGLHAASPVHSLHCASPHAVHKSPDGRGGQSPYCLSATGSAANVDYFSRGPNLDNERIPASALRAPPKVKTYTHNLRHQPARTFIQQLRPFHGRLNNDKWLKVMVRPFVLFSYPAVLWSAAVYACSIGWLIVISETMAIIYRDPNIYNFGALQTGLVYISPFIGGVLGTGVAGKISDVLVRAMSRRNGGLYEPEFRLVMAIPIMMTTCIGLMGFGWSAQERDHWIVPTLFFGVLSFGCSLGSTTAITFCVDSYRQYAGEALVTLNFCKNVLHGLIFSLFVSHWMADEGPKAVFIWLGVIQLVVQLTTIPLFVFGKRARMWTVRKNLMEKF